GNLLNRNRLNFYGAKVKDNLIHFPKEEQKEFKKAVGEIYDRAMAYLEEWFDFNNSIYKKFSVFNLQKELNSNDVDDIAKILNVELDRDALFDECGIFNLTYKEVEHDKTNNETDRNHNAKYWLTMLSYSKLPNLA